MDQTAPHQVDAPAPAPVTEPPRPGSAWASPHGTFLMATQACGCQVKVRTADAAERMRAVSCKRHSS